MLFHRICYCQFENSNEQRHRCPPLPPPHRLQQHKNPRPQCVCVLRAHLVTVHHEVVCGNQGFEDHHPAGVAHPLHQRVDHLGHVHVGLVLGGLDQVWRRKQKFFQRGMGARANCCTALVFPPSGPRAHPGPLGFIYFGPACMSRHLPSQTHADEVSTLRQRLPVVTHSGSS